MMTRLESPRVLCDCIMEVERDGKRLLRGGGFVHRSRRRFAVVVKAA
jgi:hypothetical protein